MSTNARIYYATQCVGITANMTSTVFGSSNMVFGLQSCGMNVNFNTEDIMQMGMIDTYTSMEDRPKVTCTLEKVLDGKPLIYWLATNTAAVASGAYTLGGRTKDPCKIGVGIFSDYQTVASGAPQACIIMSGMYVESLDYNLVVDGNFSESVSLGGYNRVWSTSDWFQYDFNGNEAPVNANQGVLKRWNIDFTKSLFPTDIRGISASGTNNQTNGAWNAHLQSIKASVNLAREDLNELGTKAPYYSYAKYPVDVTCSIGVTASDGDWKNAYDNQTNLSNQALKFVVGDDTLAANRVCINLGTKNKLTSIEVGGGGTDGGNVTLTYNYTTKNTMSITGDADVSNLGLIL